MKGRTINEGYVVARQLERIISLDTKQQCLKAKNIPVDYVNTVTPSKTRNSVFNDEYVTGYMAKVAQDWLVSQGRG